jgi:hypothetical protein
VTVAVAGTLVEVAVGVDVRDASMVGVLVGDELGTMVAVAVGVFTGITPT